MKSNRFPKTLFSFQLCFLFFRFWSWTFFFPGLYIRPNNAVVKNGDLSFAPYPRDDPDKYLPDVSSFGAGNWFDEKKNLLYVVVKGKEPVRIVTVPIIQVIDWAFLFLFFFEEVS